jgi:hypothetical protein
VNVGGDVAQLVTNKDAIIAGFVKSGFMANQAGILFTNLVDYVDVDFTPGNLGNPALQGVAEGPSVEPVWMLNEVAVSNYLTFTYSGSNYMVSGAVKLSFECFYPFLMGGNSGCTLNYRVIFTNCAASTYVSAVNPLLRSNVPISLAPPYAPMPHLPPIQGNVVGGVVASVPVGTIAMEAHVYAWIEKNGFVVDSCTNSPIVMTWTLPVPVAVGSNYVTQRSFAYECLDPRLNYLGLSHWLKLNNANTLGNTNTATLQSLNQPVVGKARDGDTVMYVANKNIGNVGVLGCLFFGNAWETVRLYKHGLTGVMHPVLDNFTTDSPTGAVVRGKVHLGTRQREVMTAVYENMPIDAPGLGNNRLSGALLSNVVDAVMVMTETNIVMGKSLKLSDLGTANWTSLYPVASYPGSTDLDRESFVRNSVGLFGVRQNYFIILLYAQGTKAVAGIPDNTVLTGVRGVAEVWRDPQTNSAGIHPMVVKSFKILSE